MLSANSWLRRIIDLCFATGRFEARALFICTIVAGHACITVAQPAGGPAQLRFVLAANGTPHLEMNGERVIPNPLSAGAPRFERSAVSVWSEGDQWWVKTGLATADLSFSGVPDFTVELPIEASISVTANPENSWLDFSAGEVHPRKVMLRLSDKGYAEMGTGAQARIDFYKNGTYALLATTNCLATSADGLKLKFPNGPPLLGGPLVQARDAGGVAKFMRTSPATPIHLIGDLQKEMKLMVDAREVPLIKDQDKLIATANGSKFLFRHNSSRSAVEWSVAKGAAHITIEGFNNWKAASFTGQAGSLQWNTAQKIIDLKNSTSDAAFPAARNSYVFMIGQVQASLSPRAIFQYAQFRQGGSFATTASGAPVFLTDVRTGETTPVHIRGVSYDQGVSASAGPLIKAALNTIQLSWDTDTRVLLSGKSATIAAEVGAEKALSFAGGDLAIRHETEGNLVLRAKNGAFEIRPDFLKEFSFQLGENASVHMNLQRRRSMLVVQPAPDNASTIHAASTSGFSLLLAGDEKITIVLGHEALFPDRDQFWIFFEGAGGSPGFVPVSGALPLLPPPSIDASRIPQPPVSVLQ